MRLANILEEYDAEAIYKILKRLDAEKTRTNGAVVKCPEIVYTTDDYTDISMESLDTIYPVSLRGKFAGKGINVDLAFIRMHETEYSDSKTADVQFLGDKVSYGRSSLNATFMGMQYISDLFLRGITPHVPMVFEAATCFDTTKMSMNVIYMELMRTRFKNGPLTRTLKEILDPKFDDKILSLKNSKTAEILDTCLKVQLAATLDLLDSYDIYVGDIDAGSVIVSRFRKRPMFRHRIMDNYAYIQYILSDGTTIRIPSIKYFIRVADIHTFAIRGKIIYEHFIDGTEGKEIDNYNTAGHREHVSSHVYTSLRAGLYGSDPRPWSKIAASLSEKISSDKKQPGKILVIKSKQIKK